MFEPVTKVIRNLIAVGVFMALVATGAMVGGLVATAPSDVIAQGDGLDCDEAHCHFNELRFGFDCVNSPEQGTSCRVGDGSDEHCTMWECEY